MSPPKTVIKKQRGSCCIINKFSAKENEMFRIFLSVSDNQLYLFEDLKAETTASAETITKEALAAVLENVDSFSRNGDGCTRIKHSTCFYVNKVARALSNQGYDIRTTSTNCNRSTSIKYR
jgi:hypothetical protein